MDDLVAFCRQQLDARERQLDEDERVASACPDKSWRQIGNGTGAEHIARFDPQRMLAEVEQGRRDIAAKRAILDEARRYSPELEHGDNGEWAFDMVIRLLAQEFAGQEGWREEWAPQHVPYNEVVEYPGDDD